MGLDRQEEVVILYALHERGGRASKSRVIDFILSNGLVKYIEGDDIIRANNERKVENDLAWARQNLKEKAELRMPQTGVWEITEGGRQRLARVAANVFRRKPDDAQFERYSSVLLDRLFDLGQKLNALTLPPASAV